MDSSFNLKKYVELGYVDSLSHMTVQRLLKNERVPSLKNIQAILLSEQDKVTEGTSDKYTVESNYSLTRGAEYYGCIK